MKNSTYKKKYNPFLSISLIKLIIISFLIISVESSSKRNKKKETSSDKMKNILVIIQSIIALIIFLLIIVFIIKICCTKIGRRNIRDQNVNTNNFNNIQEDEESNNNNIIEPIFAKFIKTFLNTEESTIEKLLTYIFDNYFEVNLIYNKNDEKFLNKCPICLSVYNENDNICSTRCNHLFHEKCMRGFLLSYIESVMNDTYNYKDAKCPMCNFCIFSEKKIGIKEKKNLINIINITNNINYIGNINNNINNNNDITNNNINSINININKSNRNKNNNNNGNYFEMNNVNSVNTLNSISRVNSVNNNNIIKDIINRTRK